ncbi:hypothetical protein B0H14DRAFT_3025467 [Mycena olivaceomarginata]|nr:hypothetical protein B0H14DRAFT_3025467 [Mycena olivaceomarginata]
MLVPIDLTIDPVDDSDSDGDLIDEILGTKNKLKVKEEEADFPMSVKSEPIETELCSTRSITQRKKAKPTPSLCFTSPVTFTKEFLSTSLDHPTNNRTLSCGDDHYLARRLESSQFRFSPELELEAARGLIPRRTFLLRLSVEQNTVLGHLVCQPKPDIPFNKVVEPELDILNAISHYSLVQNNNALLFTKFKVASVNGSLSIFAPITHSRSSSSGLYDEGPEAIDQFMDGHVAMTSATDLGSLPSRQFLTSFFFCGLH